MRSLTTARAHALALPAIAVATAILSCACADVSREPPSLISLTPSSGMNLGPVTLTIRGQMLAPDGKPPEVFLDNVPLEAPTMLPSGELTAIVPAGLSAGPRSLFVYTSRRLVAAMSGAFTVLASPVPRVRIVSPADATAVRAGDAVQVLVEALAPVGKIAQMGFDIGGGIDDSRQAGSIFVPAQSVLATYTLDVPEEAWNGQVLHLRAWAIDDEALPVLGQSPVVTLQVAFGEGPAIFAIAPAHGPAIGGNVVTIAGQHFLPSTEVLLGGSPLIAQRVLSQTRITGLAPPHASGLVDVEVRNGNGAATLARAFEYFGAPAIVQIVSTQPASLVADGVSRSVVTARVVDSLGAPVAGESLSVLASTGTLGLVVDNGDGTYEAPFTAPTATGNGAAAVAVIDPSAATVKSASTTIALLPGAATSLRFLSVTPAQLVADGTSKAVAILDVSDAHGNPVPGKAPALVATSGLQIGAVVDRGDGSYSVIATAPRHVPAPPGATLTATLGALTATSSIALVPGPAAALSIETALDGTGTPILQSTIVAGARLRLYSVLRDAQGNFIGPAVSNWTLLAPLGNIDALPTSAATFTSLRTGVTTLRASSGGFGASTLVTISPGPLAGFISGVPQNAIVGLPLAVAILAVDEYANVIPSFVGSVELTDLSGSIAFNSGPFSKGMAIASLLFLKPWRADQLNYADSAGHTGKSGTFDVVLTLPTLASIAANSGLLGGGTPVSIQGAGFFAIDTVTIGGRALLQPTLVNGTTIRGLTPAGAAIGSVDVVVTRANTPVTLANAFTYVHHLNASVIANGTGGFAQTTIRSEPGSLSWNFSAEPVTGVGTVDALATPSLDRALIAFDIRSLLPAGATVVEARLDLYATSQGTTRLVPLTVANKSASALAAGLPVVATFNHAAAVTRGLSAATGDDVHVLHRNGAGSWSEVPRTSDAQSGWNRAATSLWFALQAPLAAGATDSTSYAIGYGVISAPARSPVLGAIFSPAPSAQTTALYYCEDGNGSLLLDSSGNNRNAMLTAAPSTQFGAGHTSGGIGFDGTGSGKATVPSPNGDFTLETWFKTAATSAALVGWGVINAGRRPIGIYLASGVVAADVQMNGANANISGGPSVNDGLWHHAALVLQGTGGANEKLQLFVDGTLVGSAAALGQPSGAMGNKLWIGADGVEANLVGSLDGISARSVAVTSFPYAAAPLSALAGIDAINALPQLLGVHRLYRSFTSSRGAPSLGQAVTGPTSWALTTPSNWVQPGASAASDAATDFGIADRALTPLGAIAVDTIDAWYSLDVTDAAQRWLDGTWAPNGVLLKLFDETQPFRRIAFASGNNANPALHPRVTVSYVVGASQPVTVDIPLGGGTSISAATPASNFAASSTFAVAANAAAQESRGLVRFDVNALIPAGRTVVSAQLIAQHLSDASTGGALIAARQLLTAFTPALATWNLATAMPWNVAGASGAGTDRIEAPITSTWALPTPSSANWNVARATQTWLDDATTNHGVLLQVLGQSAPFNGTYSLTATPPILRVTYLP